MAETFSNLIRILATTGVGPKRTMDLVRKFGSLDHVFSSKLKHLIELPGVTTKIAQAILAPVDQDLLTGQTYLLEKFNAHLISVWDVEYPELLKQIYDPPIALFCRGDIEILKSNCIGMVGTRTPTHYGKEMTIEFSQELAGRGFTLVSGAAKGIDALVHHSCIKAGGKTIAVLGNGVDRVYPAENRSLYTDIAEKGLLISEFLLGTKPDAQNFPRRNRIISGLAAGTIVMEAAEKSGSLITAYFSLDQNREVFALPGSVKSRQSHGTHHLIRQGAKLVETVDDVLEEFGEKYRLGASLGQQELIISVEPREAAILKYISDNESIHIDDLARLSGQTTFSLLGALLPMEMKGLVQQLPGKYFQRKV